MNKKEVKQLLYEAYVHGQNELWMSRFDEWVKKKLEDLK